MLDGLLDGRDLELLLGAGVAGGLQALADVAAQFVHGLELADVGGEGVVQVGDDLLLDLLDGHGELRLLAGELLRVVVLGEGDVEGLLGAGRQPEELLFEPRDEVAAADLVHLVLALRALDKLAVTAAGHVHEHEVAVLDGAVLDRLQARKPLLQHRQLRRDLLVGDLHLALGDLEALVLAEGRHGHGLDLEREAVVLGLVQRADLQVRGADGVLPETGLAEGLVAPLRDGVLEGLAADEVCADVLDHEVDRHAALAEPRELHLVADLGHSAVVGLLHGLGRDFDAELDLVLACGVDLRLHCRFSVCRWNGPPATLRGLRTAKWSVQGEC